MLLMMPVITLWVLTREEEKIGRKTSHSAAKGGSGHCVVLRGTKSALESTKIWPANWLAKLEKNVINQNLATGLDSCFDSCAIVFSSGKLVDRGLGASIDGHDAVFRMNDAPSVGFEHDVGKRTTVRVANFNTCIDLAGFEPGQQAGFRSLPKCAKLFEASSAFNFAWGSRKRLHVSGLPNYQAPPFWTLRQGTSGTIQPLSMLLHEALPAEKDAQKYDGTMISTGWYSLYLACRMCSRIRIYGKGAANSSSPVHYYSPNGATEGGMSEYISHTSKNFSVAGTAVHDYDLELRAMRSLALAYHIDGVG
jgi:hypothetical protein